MAASWSLKDNSIVSDIAKSLAALDGLSIPLETLYDM